MREKFFRFLLTKLEKHTPGWIKSIQIQILLNTTAAAFDRLGRMVWQLPAQKALAAYAEYTRACVPDAAEDAVNAVTDGAANGHANETVNETANETANGPANETANGPAIDAANEKASGPAIDAANETANGPVIDRKRIFRCAYGLGRRIRKISGFTEREDRERLVFYLYSSIGIKMTGRLPGEILIPVCYFGNIYTPEQCMTMSLMDRGIISGICGRGKLVFTERIPQGCGRCRAVFAAGEKRN